MPRFPVITARKLIKILKKAGFIEYHQVGSHLQLKHSDGRRTTVSNHPSHEIGRKTLKSILNDMRISPEEFRKLSKK